MILYLAMVMLLTGQIMSCAEGSPLASELAAGSTLASGAVVPEGHELVRRVRQEEEKPKFDMAKLMGMISNAGKKLEEAVVDAVPAVDVNAQVG